ncbi:MAG: methyltransferase domain-containing protein [Rhodothermales bacterium]|nr:methyltransferase domain-containing protein [Rhodothermales bacterium]
MGHLKVLLGPIGDDEDCLLVTCGDNNGAINYYLRELGGQWSFADLEAESLDEMSRLLGTPVDRATENRLPYEDSSFDRIVAIDTHEHVERPDLFTGELERVARPGCQVVITVPGGDMKKPVNRLKNRIGMTRERYGHVRDGFSTSDVQSLLGEAGLEPGAQVTFSKFFTEMIELGINFLYVNVLSRKSEAPVEEGTIAPQTEAQVQSVGKAYRLYSLVYPFFWLISRLDALLFFTSGYVVMVEGRKPGDAP